MQEICELHKSKKGIFKFNQKSWDLINKFFESEYDDIYLSIELENEDRFKFDDLDKAIIKIKECKQEIDVIHINGVNTIDNSSANINIHNIDNYSKPTLYTENYKKPIMFIDIIYPKCKKSCI